MTDRRQEELNVRVQGFLQAMFELAKEHGFATGGEAAPGPRPYQYQVQFILRDNEDKQEGGTISPELIL